MAATGWLGRYLDRVGHPDVPIARGGRAVLPGPAAGRAPARAGPSAAGGSPRMISEAVGEGGGATKTVRVTPGTWRLYCALDGHGAMTRDLAVE